MHPKNDICCSKVFFSFLEFWVLHFVNAIRYDTKRYFNVRSKADTSASLIYRTGPTTKKRKAEKLKKEKKRICSEVSINSPGNSCSPSWRRKGRLQWEGFAEKEGFKPRMRVRGWLNSRLECSSVRRSVRLSVRRSTIATSDGAFAAERPAGRRYRSTAACHCAVLQAPELSSKCGQRHVESRRRRRLNTDLFICAQTTDCFDRHHCQPFFSKTSIKRIAAWKRKDRSPATDSLSNVWKYIWSRA